MFNKYKLLSLVAKIQAMNLLKQNGQETDYDLDELLSKANSELNTYLEVIFRDGNGKPDPLWYTKHNILRSETKEPTLLVNEARSLVKLFNNHKELILDELSRPAGRSTDESIRSLAIRGCEEYHHIIHDAKIIESFRLRGFAVAEGPDCQVKISWGKF